MYALELLSVIIILVNFIMLRYITIIIINFNIQAGEQAMNKEIIIKMVQPYLKNSFLTYNEFDNLFNMLSLREQYGVLEVLAQNHIELITDENESGEDEFNIKQAESELCVVKEDLERSNLKKDFEILYDDLIFSDKRNNNKEENEYIENCMDLLEIKKDVKQSNEILCILIQQGNQQARQDLCIKNIKLVDKIASKYEKFFGNDLTFDDLEQAGMIGMLVAAERFNVSLGYSFSTYAVWWIRQTILREIYNNGFTIRLPVHVMEKICKINVLDRDLSINGLEYNERIKEMAEELDTTEDDIKKLMTIQNNFLRNVSLDTPVGEDGDTTMLEVLPVETEISVEDEVTKHCLKNQITNVFETLTVREQKVLNLRFGLTDGRARTLEEISGLFGVTRERIRQIEEKALKKLRHPYRSKKFVDFY